MWQLLLPFSFSIFLWKPSDSSSSPADYIKRYATEAVLQDDEDGSSESESDMSDLSEDEIQDMEL